MPGEKLAASERKSQILQAAYTVFLEKGYQQTTMEDIRQKTGLSRGGLYYHYQSPDAMLHDLICLGNQMRKETIHSQITLRSAPIDEAFVADLLLDKMLADNTYTPLYVIFLLALDTSPSLANLYENIKAETKSYFDQLFIAMGYQALSDQTWEFLNQWVNAGLIACEKLGGREIFMAQRPALKTMFKAYLTTYAPVQKKEEKNETTRPLP